MKKIINFLLNKKLTLTLQIIFFSVISIITLSSAQATVQKPSADYYEQVLQAYAYALSRLDFTLSDFCISQPDVQKRRDVFYLPNEEVGITATSICAYKEQYGKYASKGKLINGKFDGKWTYWYENGQIKSEQSYNNGNLDGNHTAWYEDGQMRYEKSYSYGKADGKHTTWYENGQKDYELNYKWGKDDGKWTFWHEDGQVKRESNYKDGVCLSGYCLIVPPIIIPESPPCDGNWTCNEGYIKKGNRCFKAGELPQEVIEKEIAEFEAPLTQEAIEKEIAEFEANLAKEIADYNDSLCM